MDSRRLHKHLFGVKFCIVHDRKGTKSPHLPFAAMIQKWNSRFSAYNFTIEHRVNKSIPHTDFPIRHLYFKRPSSESDCILVQPLPVDIADRVQDS
ncbi:hypothetical protein Smp_135310 [Schistosoma mansoni]|uniref:hypothetical protein n=1 Tax=Schistosoma mansoni TaxID=6183 RepID=UPI0001A6315C|nr:hypothetical protein Smp_135310 [Schistosoma mansoni]|eukprot:XP_018655100.1 hypothetical protein Smp_135310 [Schistosoma mansoni]